MCACVCVCTRVHTVCRCRNVQVTGKGFMLAGSIIVTLCLHSQYGDFSLIAKTKAAAQRMKVNRVLHDTSKTDCPSCGLAAEAQTGYVSLLHLAKVDSTADCWVCLKVRCISANGWTHVVCQHTCVCAHVLRLTEWVCTEATTLCLHYRTDGEAFTVSIISPCAAPAESPVDNRTQQTHSCLT